MRHGEGESIDLCCGAGIHGGGVTGQLKCLYMSVGQRGDTVAMFTRYMKGPKLSNETQLPCACVYATARERGGEGTRVSSFPIDPPPPPASYFFHSASLVACLVAHQTSATSKYRAGRLATVTSGHACFTPRRRAAGGRNTRVHGASRVLSAWGG